ncbi:molecular chaperone DnaJ [Paractinoplanes rishiriensis]|uniref:Protein kinase domain-containing protein n=1 Tax=Paractinoplanes rishiriensis TaxID=1050105 RepID=A0A919JQA5_9ACTN|nr:molecular chaperone DnaJ [Actinoplanes rishiriensis]GIE92925.1 hypothetical protein Ari01nite_03900 [Actinoplanes rishiriensis]
MMTFAEAVARVRAAGSYADLKGAASYREWARILHPDVAPEGLRATATTAFGRLSGLYAERDGTVLRTPRGEYRVGAVVHSGDIADLAGTRGGGALVKLPREPRDNDLMAAEAAALLRLRDGDPTFRPYAPRLIDSFRHEDGSRVQRTVNVLERLDGFVPLSDLRRTIDPRDAAWMFRRLLTGLGWAHRAGVVHGAVLEEHVLIHPAEHGLALVDWCYSGERVVAVVKHRRDAYPPEVFTDRRNTPATDVYMAVGLLRRLVGDGLPAALQRFADGCSYDAPRMRPQDPWALLGEFDELLHKLYGPRTFRPFTV